jgi:hypothetical protein
MKGDPRFLLLGGIIFLVIGLVSLLTGETLTTRYSRQPFVGRSGEPKKFWFYVAFYLLGGLVLIGLYIARISN